MGHHELHDNPAFRAIGLVAERQHGVASLAQIRAAGFSRGALEHRVRAGQFLRVHRGVYAIGHLKLGPWGFLWAAHLATGGALSHQSAAWAWALIPPPSMPVHVTVTGNQRSRKGIRVHTTTRPEVTRLDGLPVTTVERTLADLPPRLRARATREARFLGLVGGPAPAHRTRSGMEHDLLDLVEAAGLPRPLVNHVVDGRERDFHWPDHGLVVETDGPQHAWADDRRRDRELFTRTGIVTLRFTDVADTDDVTRTLTAALARVRTLSRGA